MRLHADVWVPAGTFERGRRERARQDQLISNRGGIMRYVHGCTCSEKHIDGCVSDVVQFNPRDTIENG